MRKARLGRRVSSRMRRGWKIALCLVGIGISILFVRSCLYERYKSACEDISPGMDLEEAGDILEGAGGKHVAVVGDEHQWLRVRVSLKHQLCRVKVDAKDKVISARYEDSWDLL